MAKTYDNVLPINIVIDVNYFEDDDENITAIDVEGMQKEFDKKIEELKALNK